MAARLFAAAQARRAGSQLAARIPGSPTVGRVTFHSFAFSGSRFTAHGQRAGMRVARRAAVKHQWGAAGGFLRRFCSTASSPETKKVFWGARYPLAFGTAVATAKTALADVFTQKVLEKREHLDFRRVGVFTAFGFFYLGLFQYKLYVTLFSKWFSGTARFANQPLAAKLKDTKGQLDLLKQIAFDNFVHIQWFFPIYYIIKQSVIDQNNNIFNTPASQVVSSALGKYSKNFLDDWMAFWKIWIIGDAFVMGLCPLWMRLPANHAISFVYVIVLSFMRGANDQEPAEKTQALQSKQ